MHDEQFPVGREVYYRESPYIDTMLCTIVSTFHTTDLGTPCYGLELKPIKCRPSDLMDVLGRLVPTFRVWSLSNPSGVQVGGMTGWVVSDGGFLAPEIKANLVDIPLQQEVS